MTEKILFDAGHGGKDSGAVSRDGSLLEKDITLKVAKRAAEITSARLLKQGDLNRIKCTRLNDVFHSLLDRSRLANRIKACLISIHCNAGGGDGIEIFTTKGRTESDAWATELYKQADDFIPGQVKRTDYSDGDPDKEANFSVLRKTARPAVLVELGFIDTEKGKAFLESEANLELLARWIASATLKARYNISLEVKSEDLTIEERVARIEKHLNLD